MRAFSGGFSPQLIVLISRSLFSTQTTAMIRQASVHITRDNVLFEFGLFTGRIGTGRAFWISAQDSEKTHLPSDLAGIIHLSYKKPLRFDLEKLRAALQKPCEQLETQITELGRRTDRTIEELDKPRILCAASSQYSEPKLQKTSRRFSETSHPDQSRLRTV